MRFQQLSSRFLLIILAAGILLQGTIRVVAQGDAPHAIYLPVLLDIQVRDIGSNQFGYVLRDTRFDPDITYTWEEIQDTGTEITQWLNGKTTIPTGFYFPFYDGRYNLATISQYGVIQFGFQFDEMAGKLGGFRPYGGYLAEGHIYYEHRTQPDRLIIEYDHIRFSDDVAPSTFQIVLYDSGDILISYAHLIPLPPSMRYISINDLVDIDPLRYSDHPGDQTAVKFLYPQHPRHTYPPSSQRWRTYALPPLENVQYARIFLDQNSSMPHSIFVAAEALLHSADGGETWTSITPYESWGMFANASAYAWAPTPGSEVIFAAVSPDGALYRSANHGLSWARAWQPPGLRIEDIACSPNNQEDHTMYLVGWSNAEGKKGNGFWISSDGGLSWRQSPEAHQLTSPRRIHFSTQFQHNDKIWVTSYTNTLYFSDDGGESWQHVPLMDELSMSYTLAVAPRVGGGDELFLVAWLNASDIRLFVSLDDGLHWGERSRLPWGAQSIFVPSSYPEDPSLFLLAPGSNRAALLRSNDGGVSWTPYDTGIPAGHVVALAEHQKTRTLFALVKKAASQNQLYRRSPTMDHWELVTDDTPAEIGVVQPGYAINAQQKVTVIANQYLTHDEGKHWEYFGEEVGYKTVVAAIASPQFQTDGKVWVVTRDRLMATSDRGRTWQPVLERGEYSFSMGNRPLAVSPSFSQDGIIFADIQNNIWRSVDGGATWENITVSGGASLGISPDFHHDQTIYATGQVSKDAGTTWSTAGFGYKFRVSPDYVQDHAVFQLAQPQQQIIIQRTTDDGQTWQHVASLPGFLESASELVLSPCLASHPTMIVGQKMSWRGETWLSDDGGRTWRWFGAGKLNGGRPQGYFYMPETGRLYHIGAGGLWWSQVDWPSPEICPN